MNSFENLQQPRGNELIDALNLKKGVEAYFRKVKLRDSSQVPEGRVRGGVVANNPRVGEPIYFDDGSTISNIRDVYIQGSEIYVETQTSLYVILRENNKERQSTRLTKGLLQQKLEEFKAKEYGEWAMFTGEVPVEDSPYERLFVDNGFGEGDRVVFFSGGKEREGYLDRDAKGALVLRDRDGNPWGTAGILNSEEGYIEMVEKGARNG